MDTKIKNGLLGFLFIFLVFPLAEQCINFIHTAPLEGVYVSATDPPFSFTDWWDGVFQRDKNKFLNDNVGFRPDMVRCNNQIDYSCFSKFHFSYGILGKDHTIWDEKYIQAYEGYDFVGYDSIKSKIVKLKKIQDTLTALGKRFILIQAPNKAFYYPEFLPDRFGKKSRPTNSETYSRVADSMGINYIDFNSWIVTMKDKSKEVLYTKKGVHWSVYGAYLAWDILANYVNKKGGNLSVAICDKIEHTQVARLTDNDLGIATNLAIPFSHDVYSYPVLRFPDEHKKDKTSAIYIGDSFLCQWYFLNMYQHAHSHWQMWYYFKGLCDDTHPFENVGNSDIFADRNWIEEINKTDNIIMVYTSTNLPELGNGFVEQAYNHYYPRN